MDQKEKTFRFYFHFCKQVRHKIINYSDCKTCNGVNKAELIRAEVEGTGFTFDESIFGAWTHNRELLWNKERKTEDDQFSKQQNDRIFCDWNSFSNNPLWKMFWLVVTWSKWLCLIIYLFIKWLIIGLYSSKFKHKYYYVPIYTFYRLLT